MGFLVLIFTFWELILCLIYDKIYLHEYVSYTRALPAHAHSPMRFHIIEQTLVTFLKHGVEGINDL